MTRSPPSRYCTSRNPIVQGQFLLNVLQKNSYSEIKSMPHSMYSSIDVNHPLQSVLVGIPLPVIYITAIEVC